MDPMNLTLGLPFAQAHAEVYGFLLFVLPALSFLSVKIWLISKDGAKAEHTTQWLIPHTDDADAVMLVFNYSRRSVIFVQQAHTDATQPSEAQTANREPETCQPR